MKELMLKLQVILQIGNKQTWNKWIISNNKKLRYFEAYFNLKKGEYQYKYIVDGIWMLDKEA